MIKYLFSFVLLVFLTSCSDNNKPDPVHVDVKIVHRHNVPYVFNYPAFVQGVVDYPVIPRISGVLYKKYYTEGTVVKKGQPLYEVDPRPYKWALKGYEGQLIKDTAARDNYKIIYKRYVDLYRYKAVSKQDVETARINYRTAVGNVKTDKANIDQTKLNLNYCLVRSPANGYIAERTLTLGSMVTAFETVLNNINSTDNMYLLFSMPENQRLGIEDGLLKKKVSIPENNRFRLDIELANGKIIPDAAYVEFTDTRIALTNGVWNMRGYVDNRSLQNKLLAGQFVSVYLHGLEYLDVFSVPQTAVMNADQGFYVYVVQEKDKEKKAFRRYVKMGKMYNQTQWIILDGLKDGDQVVVSGNIRLQDGSYVAIDKTYKQPTTRKKPSKKMVMQNSAHQLPSSTVGDT